MKLLRLLSFALLAAFVLNLSSCRKDPVPTDSLTYIPAHAASVSTINLQQLMGKADYPTLIQTAGFQKMIADIAEENPTLSAIVAHPEQSGIDLQQNVYFSNLLSETEAPLMVFSASLSDSAAFGRMIRSTEIQLLPVSQPFNYASTPDRGAIAWNNEVALLAVSNNKEGVQDRLKALLENADQQSVAENASLRKHLQGDHDLLNWFSSDFILQSDKFKSAGALLNYKEEDLQGQHLAHTLTFEKGYVSSSVALDLQGQIRNDLSMLFKDKVQTDFAALAPAGAPVFLLTAAFDITGLNQLLIEKYTKGFAEESLSAFGFNIEGLIDELDGDIMLAAYDEMNLVFAARIKDEDRFLANVNAAAEEGSLDRISDRRFRFLKFKKGMPADATGSPQSIDIDGQILVQNGLVYLASNPDWLQKVEAGDTGLQGSLADVVEQSMMQQIFTAVGAPAAFSKWNDDLRRIEDIRAGATREGIELRVDLKEKEKNSLRYLIEQVQEEEVSEL
ncbi:MAG: DUF4836 family protein [Phaeodactylibacter sp.]|uniref:DUF4836 family protein n=1 Tax=Phaeodactylibacter sp. TaxID=1940289 RepID=UPI0032F08128